MLLDYSITHSPPEFADYPGRRKSMDEQLDAFLKGKTTLRNEVSEARNKYPHSDLIRAQGTQSRGRTWLAQKTVPELHWLRMVVCS